MSISAINARNQFKGTVQEIIRGPVLSEVDVQTPAGRKPLSDYLLTVALSGDGKSTADGVALAPVRQLEHKEYRQYQQDRAAWEGIPRKARGDQLVNPPVNPLRLVNDFTAEGLIRQYREGSPSLGAFSDEGGAVLGGHAFSVEKKLSTAATLSSRYPCPRSGLR